jgi:hypothetical protein
MAGPSEAIKSRVMAAALLNFATPRSHRTKYRPSQLFGLLQPLALSQAHARAAAVLFDELDAGGFKRSSDRIQCRKPRDVGSRLKMANCYETYPRFARQVPLAPAK